uniref:Uncharacterized protein n=1 Tax=Meteorus pulchricornis TaxID=51522 RepID=H7CHK4_9HYME|nr:hypothetical protein [Meteorus pulchricornis]
MKANNKISIILLAFTVVAIAVNATPVEQIKPEHDHINAQAVAKKIREAPSSLKTLFWPELNDEKVVAANVPKESDVVLHNLQKRSPNDEVRRRERPKSALVEGWENFSQSLRRKAKNRNSVVGTSGESSSSENFFNSLRRKSKNRKSMVDPPAKFSPILLRRQPSRYFTGHIELDPVGENPNRRGFNPEDFENLELDKYFAAQREQEARDSGAGSSSQQHDSLSSPEAFLSDPDEAISLEKDLSGLNLDDSRDSNEESSTKFGRLRHKTSLKESFKRLRKMPFLEEDTRL